MGLLSSSLTRKHSNKHLLQQKPLKSARPAGARHSFLSLNQINFHHELGKSFRSSRISGVPLYFVFILGGISWNLFFHHFRFFFKTCVVVCLLFCSLVFIFSCWSYLCFVLLLPVLFLLVCCCLLFFCGCCCCCCF